MDRIEARVIRTRDAAERIREIVLAAPGLPDWTPGAHLDVTLPDGETRSYSLLPAQEAGTCRLGVLLEEASTGGSRFMHGLGEGDTLTVSAPANDFPVDTAAPALLLAGGIGVTPLVSMAAALDAAGQEFAFHYTARSAARMAFREELETRFGDRLHLHFDDDASALDLDALIAGLGPRTHLYICGPRGLIDAARTRAEAAGVPPARIHVELFANRVPSAGDTAFEVEIADGRVFTVAPGESIIEALEAEGVDLIYDCRRGDCGICQTEVLAGVPDHRDVVLSEAERAGGKVMQICVSRAKTDRLVLDI